MRAGWKKVLLFAMIASIIMVSVAGCKEKSSSAQRSSQRSTTTQRQAEKALEE